MDELSEHQATLRTAGILSTKLEEKLEHTIKGLYEGRAQLDPESALALLLCDPERTRSVRALILDDMIWDIVCCASEMSLLANGDDPTRVEYTRALQILFEHSIEKLLPRMGKFLLAGFLGDLADRLINDEDFEAFWVGSIMDSYMANSCAWSPRDRKKEMEELARALADL